MENSELLYQAELNKLELMITEEINSFFDPAILNAECIEKSQSTLDAWDYCFSLAIGMAGVFISTNEKFAEYLDGIHKAASGAGGEYSVFQSFLGEKLYHQGDYIDSLNGTFKNRNGENAYGLFHRLLWGHDIFSIGEDNPFKLMFEQKGMSGILQAVRHLLADTTSKQGLPLPGSSFFDNINEHGKTSNYLIGIAQNLSEETFGNKARAQEIYAHMMTIRAQDVVAGTVVKLLTELYFKIRGIDDKIKRAEIQLISYTVNFVGEAVVGMVRQNGIPYINIPLASAAVSAFIRFCYWNEKEFYTLSKNTKLLHAKVEELEAGALLFGDLVSENTADTYLESCEAADTNIDDLLEFFEEDAE